MIGTMVSDIQKGSAAKGRAIRAGGIVVMVIGRDSSGLW
tara:strand:- start:1716 stop:1832 length:117 start_codon:yes stop_codon:yes gene_type:complete